MTNQQILTFLRGGHAHFTLESLKTGKHYSFQAIKSDTNKLLWISVLTDGDKYVYLGTVFYAPVGMTPSLKYTVTKKSTLNPKLHTILAWFFDLLNKDKTNNKLIFRHSGKCSRCQRKLTTPESIDSGIGPVCRIMMTGKEIS